MQCRNLHKFIKSPDLGPEPLESAASWPGTERRTKSSGRRTSSSQESARQELHQQQLHKENWEFKLFIYVSTHKLFKYLYAAITQ